MGSVPSFAWHLNFIIAQAALFGRRGYIYYKEDGATASEKVALWARSLAYVGVWALLSVSTVVLAFLAGEWGDGANVAGLSIAEFFGICLVYGHQIVDGDMIARLTEEVQQRLEALLVVGLGLNCTELEQHLLINNAAVVKDLSQALKQAPWTSRSVSDQNKLVFSLGLTCAMTIEDHLWEGVLYDAAAFFQEWLEEQESSGRDVSLPEEYWKSALEEDGSINLNLLCVAVMIANEDVHMRALRGPVSDQAGRLFCASRIARRKAAAEGILRWPDCRLPRVFVNVNSIQADVSELFINNGHSGAFTRVTDMNQLPLSVLYTLRTIIKAGYLRVGEDATEVVVTFKYGNMVFPKDQWNPLRVLQKKPFRYITSATWMSGDVAFVVEQRESLDASAVKGGSGSLKGVLRIQIGLEEKVEEGCWVNGAKPSREDVWGDLGELLKPSPVFWANKPTLMAMRAFWKLVKISVSIRSMFFRIKNSFPMFRKREKSILKRRKKLGSSSVERLVLSTAERDSKRSLQHAMSQPLQDWFSGNSPRFTDVEMV